MYVLIKTYREHNRLSFKFICCFLYISGNIMQALLYIIQGNFCATKSIMSSWHTFVYVYLYTHIELYCCAKFLLCCSLLSSNSNIVLKTKFKHIHLITDRYAAWLWMYGSWERPWSLLSFFEIMKKKSCCYHGITACFPSFSFVFCQCAYKKQTNLHLFVKSP